MRHFKVFLLFSLLLLPLFAQAETIEAAGNDVISVPLQSGALVRLNAGADTVFVADPNIADVQIKTPSLIYVFGRQQGETTLFAVDQREKVLFKKKIRVSYNLTRLKESIDKMLPAANVQVEGLDRAIILSGNVNTAAEAENARLIASRFVGSDDAIINQLAITGSNQVHLRVRIAEVSRDIVKNLGINWEGLGNSGQFMFGLATGRSIISNTNSFITRAQDQGGSIFGRFQNRHLNLNSLIDALEDEGFLTVLAEPNLTAMSGETANFLAGGEFPIPVSQQQGAITIEFKSFGVGLAFTPTILNEGRISMRIRPEVSQLSNQGAVTLDSFEVPSISTRRAETTVELGSGQSLAIAGLIKQDTTQDLTKYPGLGDLPILGPLFRSDRFRRQETELVIVVTPYLAQPSNTKLALPTDGFTAPTDAQRYLKAEKYQQRPPANNSAALAAPMAHGFILD
ncbi:MAG: type II and III secretion system protein family protein [Dongiaceae bacterium]